MAATLGSILILAGFQECRLITLEFPSALAFVGARWK
jgi:hypothetical protein